MTMLFICDILFGTCGDDAKQYYPANIGIHGVDCPKNARKKSAVRFKCQTTLRPSTMCKRPLCVWNEYSREPKTSSKP